MWHAVCIGGVFNSLTAMGVQAGTKNFRPIAFSHRNKYKKDKKHKPKPQPSPPPPWQGFALSSNMDIYFQPIQCKCNADKGMGEGLVEVI